MRRVLVVDDEKLIVKGIKFGLERDDCAVFCAYAGDEALRLAKENEYDMILLDLMLPGMSGFDVCCEIRRFSNVPIIMITAKGSDEDKIRGFECGADDYVTKPFNLTEVKARMRAILRRGAMSNNVRADIETLEYKDVLLNYHERSAYIKGENINLTVKEFDVLALLMENPNKVFSREDLLIKVWNYDSPGDARTVDVHVRRLREKVEANPAEPEYVQTKWGVGYYFKED